MFLRYKRWAELNDQEQVKVYTIYNTRYEFWKKNQGICDVRIREHIERFLNPMDTLTSKFEIAYELYGIQFDERGHQVQRDGHPEMMAESRIVSTVSTSEAVVAPRPKMSMQDRMAKMRAVRMANLEKRRQANGA